MKRRVQIPEQFKMSAKDKAKIFTFSIPDAILFSDLPRTEILLFCVYYGFRAQGKSCHWTDYQLANKLHSSRSRISSYTNDLEKRGLIYCDKYRMRTPYGIKPRRAVIGINYDFCRRYSDNIRQQRQVQLKEQSSAAQRAQQTKLNLHQSSHTEQSSYMEQSYPNHSSYTEQSSHTELNYPKSSSNTEQSSYTEQNLKKIPKESSVYEQQFYKRPISCSVYELSSVATPRHDGSMGHGYNNIYNTQYNKSIFPKKKTNISSSSSLGAPHFHEAPKDDDKDDSNYSLNHESQESRPTSEDSKSRTHDSSKRPQTKSRTYMHGGAPRGHATKLEDSQRRATQILNSRTHQNKRESRRKESAFNKQLPADTRDFSLMNMVIQKSTYYHRQLDKWEALGASRQLIMKALSKANDNLSDQNYTVHRIVSYARSCIYNALASET